MPTTERESQVLKRDKLQCTACGNAARAVLAIHHIIPVQFRGSDSATNLTTLCANCHRLVHWLAAGERLHVHGGRGLGLSARGFRVVRGLASKIRSRRLREYGADGQQRTSYSSAEALAALIERNGYSKSEGAALRRCYALVRKAMRPSDWKECSRRLVRDARFLSVNAGNHLVARFPSWSDHDGRNDGEDLVLIWPAKGAPSIWSPWQFRRKRYGGTFARIPYTNIGLTLDECLALTKSDWATFRRACDDALHLVRTRSWQRNVEPR